MTVATYPVHVEARLEPELSRWLWAVKWRLGIPHVVLLALVFAHLSRAPGRRTGPNECTTSQPM